MDTRQNQKGMSFIGVIFSLIIFAFIFMFGLRLFPLYYDYYAVQDIIEKVAKETAGSNAPPMQVWRKVQKHLEVNSIGYINAEDFNILRNKNGNELVLKYDARTPYVGNIDLIARFEIKANSR